MNRPVDYKKLFSYNLIRSSDDFIIEVQFMFCQPYFPGLKPPDRWGCRLFINYWITGKQWKDL